MKIEDKINSCNNCRWESTIHCPYDNEESTLYDICNVFIKKDALNNTQDKIEILFKNFSEFLKEKNKRYGDSAINPLKIFSKIEPNNPICSRLDEKLQRIMNGEILSKNDVADTFGYLGLLMVEKNWLDFNEFLD